MSNYRSKMLMIFIIGLACNNAFMAMKIDGIDSRVKAVEAYQEKCKKIERILNLIEQETESAEQV